jgi:hypothetical protein
MHGINGDTKILFCFLTIAISYISISNVQAKPMTPDPNKQAELSQSIMDWYQKEAQRINQSSDSVEVKTRKLEELSEKLRDRYRNLSETIHPAADDVLSKKKSKTSRLRLDKILNAPPVQWRFLTEVKGVVVSWRAPDVVLLLRDKDLYRYELSSKSETHLGKLNFSSAHHPRTSNDFAFFSFYENNEIFDAKVYWDDPFKKSERVKRIYSGMIQKATGSFEMPPMPTNFKGRIDFVQKIWGTDSFFDYEPKEPSHNKSVKTFPLKGSVYSTDGAVVKNLEIPEGPWLWRYSFFDTLKYFSCGIDCYVNFEPFMVRNTLFARAWGPAVPKAGVGLFVREGNEWRRLSGETLWIPIASDDRSRFAASNGRDTFIYASRTNENP